jgi:hypothetical protein
MLGHDRSDSETVHEDSSDSSCTVRFLGQVRSLQICDLIIVSSLCANKGLNVVGLNDGSFLISLALAPRFAGNVLELLNSNLQSIYNSTHYEWGGEE